MFQGHFNNWADISMIMQSEISVRSFKLLLRIWLEKFFRHWNAPRRFVYALWWWKQHWPKILNGGSKTRRWTEISLPHLLIGRTLRGTPDTRPSLPCGVWSGGVTTAHHWHSLRHRTLPARAKAHWKEREMRSLAWGWERTSNLQGERIRVTQWRSDAGNDFHQVGKELEYCQFSNIRCT